MALSYSWLADAQTFSDDAMQALATQAMQFVKRKIECTVQIPWTHFLRLIKNMLMWIQARKASKFLLLWRELCDFKNAKLPGNDGGCWCITIAQDTAHWHEISLQSWGILQSSYQRYPSESQGQKIERPPPKRALQYMPMFGCLLLHLEQDRGSAGHTRCSAGPPCLHYAFLRPEGFGSQHLCPGSWEVYNSVPGFGKHLPFLFPWLFFHPVCLYGTDTSYADDSRGFPLSRLPSAVEPVTSSHPTYGAQRNQELCIYMLQPYRAVTNQYAQRTEGEDELE